MSETTFAASVLFHSGTRDVATFAEMVAADMELFWKEH